MILNEYRIKFKGAAEKRIQTGNWMKAAIIACADRILNGLHTDGLTIIEEDGTVHKEVELNVQ